jgi:DNA-binding transcriptional regulator YhcF (GntR family)
MLLEAAGGFWLLMAALSCCWTVDYRLFVDGIAKDGPEWAYIQLAAKLRQVAKGKHRHAALPSVRRISQEWGVSEKTARKALALLEAEEVVYVVARKGPFVGPP